MSFTPISAHVLENLSAPIKHQPFFPFTCDPSGITSPPLWAASSRAFCKASLLYSSTSDSSKMTEEFNFDDEG